MPGVANVNVCRACRTRKVRCDGSRPTCGSCSRLHLRCSLVSPRDDVVGDDAEPTPRRLRGSRACRLCRRDKVRCSGERPACQRCKDEDRGCEYPAPKRRLKNHGTSPSPSPSRPLQSVDGHDVGHRHPTRNPEPCPTVREGVAVLLPGVNEQLRLAKLFFDRIYPVSTHSYLSEESFMGSISDGTVDPSLLAALCATTVRRTNDPYYSADVAASWRARAEQDMWTHIEEPTLERLQALVLLCWDWLENGSFRRAFMFGAMASRTASALRLHHEQPEMDDATRDLRRRILWSICRLDSHMSTGLVEFQTFPMEHLNLRLPYPERDGPGGERAAAPNANDDHDTLLRDLPPSVSYAGSSSDGRSQPPSTSSPNLLATLCRIYVIRARCMQLKRQLAKSIGQSPPRLELERAVNEIQDELDDIAASGPACFPYSTEELGNHWRTRWLSRYASIHLSWNQCHCDTYRIFLRGYSEAAPEATIRAFGQASLSSAAMRCFHHASAIVTIVRDASAASKGDEILDFDFAICAFQASRLMLFLATLPHMRGFVSMRTALDGARTSLAAVRRFFNTSASAAAILSALPRLIAAYEHRLPDDDAGVIESRTLPSVIENDQDLGTHSMLRQATFRHHHPSTSSTGRTPQSNASNNTPRTSGYGNVTAGQPHSEVLLRGAAITTTSEQYAQTQAPLAGEEAVPAPDMVRIATEEVYSSAPASAVMPPNANSSSFLGPGDMYCLDFNWWDMPELADFENTDWLGGLNTEQYGT